MYAKEIVLLNEIKSKFGADGRVQSRQRIWVLIDENKLIEICKWLKEQSFAHLSAISVTDWLKDGKYELTYHLWSYNEKMLVTVKTKIDRNTPAIKSVTPIWKESAQIHERELHELFGVKFKGNPDLSPLFLENWRGPSPFKKDFDWREYVQEKFYNKQSKYPNSTLEMAIGNGVHIMKVAHIMKLCRLFKNAEIIKDHVNQEHKILLDVIDKTVEKYKVAESIVKETKPRN